MVSHMRWTLQAAWQFVMFNVPNSTTLHLAPCTIIFGQIWDCNWWSCWREILDLSGKKMVKYKGNWVPAVIGLIGGALTICLVEQNYSGNNAAQRLKLQKCSVEQTGCLSWHGNWNKLFAPANTNCFFFFFFGIFI